MNMKTPTEYIAFEQLTKRLVAVPKSELDKQVDRYNARKAKRKKLGESSKDDP